MPTDATPTPTQNYQGAPTMPLEAPCERRIAVIGGGFSGVMTAIHLLWRCRPEERVYLVEREGPLGPGVAYRTRHARHLLNVRAENMSAFEDEPNHFLRWLGKLPAEEAAACGERTAAGLFVRREVYGRYLQDLLRQAILLQGGARNFFVVDDEAVRLERSATGFRLQTRVGRSYEFHAAVLATGSFRPPPSDLPGHVTDPWNDPASTTEPPAPVYALAGGTAPPPVHPVLLIGTGLTMIDMALALVDRGHPGPIYAISRRGVLPQVHRPAEPWRGLRLGADDRRSLTSLMTAVRCEVARADAEGVDWRAVVDAIRPHVQLLWQELTPADKARFLRHLRPWWDSHRHRMAPTVAVELNRMIVASKLRILTGNVLAIEAGATGLAVTWRPRGQAAQARLTASRVIDCTGLKSDVSASGDPLLHQLRADGLARFHPTRLGLDVTPAGNLLTPGGAPTPGLFAVGPLTRGAFWEITAVPDIRSQVERVAETVLAGVRATNAARQLIG